MTPTLQGLVTLIVVGAALLYAFYRIAQALNHPKSPCEGCSGCELKGQMKKNTEKFCQKK